MKLEFSITTFINEDLAFFYNDKDCMFFIFQYEFDKETKDKNDLILKCYPAKQNLELLNEGVSIPGSHENKNIFAHTREGFVIGNISVEKILLKEFFSAAPDSTIIVTPIPNAQHHPTYISIEIKNDKEGFAILTVNPSPPARRI